MTIDNVIFGWDGDPKYAGMWELVSRVWSGYGVKPHLWLAGYGGKDVQASEEWGEVHRLPVPEYGLPWFGACAMLWGATEVEGVNMVSGIDQVPLSKAWLNVVADVDCWSTDMVVGFAGAGGPYRKRVDNVRYYPSSHVVAHKWAWSWVLRGRYRMGWGEVVKRLASGVYRTMWDGWGHDEAWLAHGIHGVGVDLRLNLFSELFFEEWDRARLDRDRGDMPVAGKEYVEMHLHRPLEANPKEWLALVGA
jgi:hypothetical protein